LLFALRSFTGIEFGFLDQVCSATDASKRQTACLQSHLKHRTVKQPGNHFADARKS
jgi:hypothetical protein